MVISCLKVFLSIGCFISGSYKGERLKYLHSLLILLILIIASPKQIPNSGGINYIVNNLCLLHKLTATPAAVHSVTWPLYCRSTFQFLALGCLYVSFFKKLSRNLRLTILWRVCSELSVDVHQSSSSFSSFRSSLAFDNTAMKVTKKVPSKNTKIPCSQKKREDVLI